MSQLTAAANFSRMQSRCNASTVGGGGGRRCCCCGGGVGVPIVSTHAVSSACCQPSASNSTISTSRRLRDGRATTAARRIRDDRAAALRGRTWRDRCGVAKAMTPAVSSRQLVGSLAALPASAPITAFDVTTAPRPSERSTSSPMQPLLPGLRRTGHEGPVDAPDQASRCGARRRSREKTGPQQRCPLACLTTMTKKRS